MRYVVVAIDPDDLIQGLSKDYGGEAPYYLCHSIARAYIKYWGLVATVDSKDYIAGVETIKDVNLPVPIFERKFVGKANVESTHFSTCVDVSFCNDLVIVKFM